MASQRRIFITGASGYIGSVATELAIADGYLVHGLSRNEASDSKLRALGAVPVRGDLTSLDILRSESAEADMVLHFATAYVFGVSESYESIRHLDYAAVDTLADGLAGTNKPLVVTSVTLAVDPDPSGAETTESAHVEMNKLTTRILTETHSLELKSRGIRVSCVRCAPYVCGRGGSSVAQFLGFAPQVGCVTTVAGGEKRTTTVHVDDAARLYLLAAEKGRAGEIYNASGSTEVTSGQIAEAMAEAVGVPVRDITEEEAKAQLGAMTTRFLSVENRASSEKARSELGWQPKGLGILEDISEGSYHGVAQGLRK